MTTALGIEALADSRVEHADKLPVGMDQKTLAPIAIALEGIGHILRDRRLDVPPYQRGYAWEAEQVADFWWDLRAAFGAAASQYFLGTVVLTSAEPGRSTVIDGQQRSATTLVMFTALRNEFLRRGDIERGTVIEREYIVTPDLRTAEDVPRLSLNDEDQHSLARVIDARPSPKRDHQLSLGESRLIDTLLFLEDRIRGEAKNAGQQWAEVLVQWVEFLERRARVIVVEVSDEADAFLIFETLNARGKELTVADLLKNYLFGLAGSDLPKLQRRWTSALDALEASADEEVFTTFVRHLWASQRGATRERELYARMKAAITSVSASMEFGTELRDAAPFYAALLSVDHPLWRENELLPLAETLLRFGLEQNRPLLLAAMRNFEAPELARLLRAVVSWSVRGLIVGGIGGGTTERAYAEAAVSVTEGRARTAAAVFQDLDEVIPSDEQFREAFRHKTINRTRLAKYILIAVTRDEAGRSDPALVSEAEESSYELGRILPRNARPEDWTDFPPDTLRQGVLRLGNQYVVDQDETLQPEPTLIDSSSWSPETISDRQDALAQRVVNIWPRRP